MHTSFLRLLYITGRLLGLLFPLLSVLPVFAQKNVSIQVNVTYLKWDFPSTDGKAEPAFTMFYDGYDNTKRFFCQTYKEDGKNQEKYVNMTRSFTRNTGTPAFTLFFQGHENDGDTNCDYDNNDERRQQTNVSFKISNQAPGVYSDTKTLTTEYYTIKFRWRYTLPAPDFLTCSGCSTSENLCANESITLTTLVDLPRKDGLRYVWEYHVSGDDNTYLNPNYESCLNSCEDALTYGGTYEQYNQCYSSCAQQYAGNLYITEPIWRALDVPGSESVIFVPGDKIPGITTNTTVDFRVRVESTELKSNNYQSSSFKFSPAAPKVASVTTTRSCPNAGSADGRIILSGISGLGNYKYILREGPDNMSYCDPEKGTCLRLAQMSKPWDHFGGTSYTIEGVPPGTYTLWIINPGGNQGVCAFKKEVTLEAIPTLTLLAPAIIDNSCNGDRNGSITIASTGGRSNLTYLLKNAQGQVLETKPPAATGATVTFSGFAAGSYQVVVTDNCGQSAMDSVEIQQPAKLTASQPILTHATCSDPGDAAATITISATNGASDMNVSGGYSYQLYKDGQPFGNVRQSNSISWTENSLPVSDGYELRVKDAAGLDCNGVRVSFQIKGPAPLQLDTLQLTHIACYGANNGNIKVTKNSLPDNSFRYLLHQANQTLEENTTGIFNNLPAGTYSVTKMRNITACQDAYTFSAITINQPPLISITYHKTDVTCFEGSNGQITASISGGTKPYSYQWQLLLGSNLGLEQDWSDLSGSNSITINHLSPGTYRLQVKDSSACQVTPPTVTITEPALLRITQVKRHDIFCFGGKGSLEPLVEGGTRPYIYQYSTDEGLNYTSFTAATPLAAGSYQVQVIDQKGCMASYEQTLTLTTPPAALAFSYTLSDYNGYHISCYRGTNGSATLSASGGNGSSYLGYSYALDNGAFQNNPVISGITAGTHTLHVKDSRGCIESKTLTFSQPNAALSVQLVGKTDIVCYGAKTGELTVRVTGGTEPYRFSLDGNSFQSPPAFTGLTTGNYTVRVKDVNGCAAILPVSLIHLHEPISITASITHVSCFDGNDGQIELRASGGAGGYHYEWSSLQQTGAKVSKLKVGSYPLSITDKEGCRKDTLFTVGQPKAPLQVYVHNTPVCADRTSGLINLSPRGGTPPYQYSIDNGASFQASNLFSVGVGNYPIVVKDSKECTVSASSTIIARNDKPEPNFLVATRQNALDTLIIKETSLPRPDSIHWTFDSRAFVIDSDAYSPKIRFADPGTYTITMTGYFGGCDYALTKTLTLATVDPVVSTTPASADKVISELSVTPNPNDGNFSFTVKLSQPQALSVVIVDVLGNEYYRKSWSKIGEVSENLQLKQLSSGFYILRAIVSTDAREARVLLHKQ